MDQDQEFVRILNEKMSELTGEDVMPGFDEKAALKGLHARMEAEHESMDDATVARILAELDKDPEWRNRSCRKIPKKRRGRFFYPLRYAAAVLITFFLTGLAFEHLRDQREVAVSAPPVRDTVYIREPGIATPSNVPDMATPKSAQVSPGTGFALRKDFRQPIPLAAEREIDTAPIASSQKQITTQGPVESVAVLAMQRHAPPRAMHYNDINKAPVMTRSIPAFADENGLVMGLVARPKNTGGNRAF